MGLVASTVGTGEAAHLASVGSATRVAVVVLIVVAICGGLWLLAKFALYQGILFRPAQGPTDGPGSLAQAPSSTELSDETGR